MTKSSVLMLALLSTVAYGVWAALAQVASRKLSPELTVVISCSFAAVTIGAYILHNGGQVPRSASGLAFALLTGLALSIAMLSFYRGVEIGSTAIVSPIVALYFVVAAILGVVFFEETLHMNDFVGIGFAIASIVLISQ
ncbi:EamA family transporter [Haloferax profundi]|nr:DMT family transporter [Haloferax profundi]